MVLKQLVRLSCNIGIEGSAKGGVGRKAYHSHLQRLVLRHRSKVAGVCAGACHKVCQHALQRLLVRQHTGYGTLGLPKL